MVKRSRGIVQILETKIDKKLEDKKSELATEEEIYKVKEEMKEMRVNY